MMTLGTCKLCGPYGGSCNACRAVTPVLTARNVWQALCLAVAGYLVILLAVV